MSRDVLVIAYHFPPILQSSGVHRTVAFVDHLADCGLNVRVLTISKNALPAISEEDSYDSRDNVKISRAWGLDTTRHLSIAGKYLDSLAIPDRYQTWIRPAVFAGKRLLAEMDDPIIFSTFPVASAHEIASRLALKCGVPWIADFRDPMYVPGETNDALKTLEKKTVDGANAITVTTDATKSLFQERYGDAVSSKLSVIENGFGKHVREVAKDARREIKSFAEKMPITLLHSGSVYGEFRDPSNLFRAVASIRDDGLLDDNDFRIVFRGANVSKPLRDLIGSLGVNEIVKILPMASHTEAVREMAGSHAYLVLQGKQFNAQIPAKVYEYLAMQRPILALTDKSGATAKLIDPVPGTFIAGLDDAEAIKESLLSLLTQLRRDPASQGLDYDVSSFDRAVGARVLYEIVWTL